MRPRLIVLFYLACLTASGQLQITVNWPLDSNIVYANFHQSNTQVLYVGIENQFSIVIPEVRTRHIDLALDTSNITFYAVWRPMIAAEKKEEPFIEYTLETAKKRGAYWPEKEKLSERYLDTNGVYWEKEYKLLTKVAKQLNITIYHYVNDTSAKLYNSITLYAEHIILPELLITDINQLKNSKILDPTHGMDFKQANDWYGIKQFTFTAFDKKDKILYNQTCFGNFITPEMRLSLEYKKLRYIVLSDIKSEKRIYDNIKIFYD